MFIHRKLKNGVRFPIIMSRATEARLQTRCFRRTDAQLAGRFGHWGCARDMFRDETVHRGFLDYLNELWEKQRFGYHSLTIHHREAIGWESTDPIDKYKPEDLEPLKLNHRGYALRVKLARKDLPAPQTRKLTIVFHFKQEDDHPVVILRSLYPGQDVGELNGDVTERERRVFFDWNHPGAGHPQIAA